jgi:hypothetical protein
MSLNTEGKECETGHVKGRSVVRVERVNEEGQEGMVDLPLLVGGRSCGLNSALGTGKASILTLVSYLQSAFLWVCETWGHEKYFPWWALNLDPVCLPLPSSYNCRSQPLSPPYLMYFLYMPLIGALKPFEVILRHGMG